MTKDERIEKIRGLRIASANTKAELKKLEATVKELEQDAKAARAQFKAALVDLRNAVKADAKITAQLLAAELSARLGGYIDKV